MRNWGVLWDSTSAIHRLPESLGISRKILYNIAIEHMPMKLDRLIKMCLNKIYSEVHISKYLSDAFSIQNGLKQDVLSPLFFKFGSEYTNGKGKEN